MNNIDRMITWCRMWNEDPSLAHELLTDDAVQWSGATPALDSVVGPDQAVAFMTSYRAEHVNVFRPRVLVDAGVSFAYTWDVTRPDGVVRSGMDVNVLRDGRIALNWTFVGDQRTDWDVAEPTRPASAGVLVDLLTAPHHPPVVDVVRGRVAALRTVDGLGHAELHVLRDGHAAHAWRFAGARAFSH